MGFDTLPAFRSSLRFGTSGRLMASLRYFICALPMLYSLAACNQAPEQSGSETAFDVQSKEAIVPSAQAAPVIGKHGEKWFYNANTGEPAIALYGPPDAEAYVILSCAPRGVDVTLMNVDADPARARAVLSSGPHSFEATTEMGGDPISVVEFVVPYAEPVLTSLPTKGFTVSFRNGERNPFPADPIIGKLLNACRATQTGMSKADVTTRPASDGSIMLSPVPTSIVRGCSGSGGSVDDVLLPLSEYRALIARLGSASQQLGQLGIAYNAKKRVLARGNVVYVPHFIASYPSGLTEIVATEEDFFGGELERSMPSEDEVVLIRLGGSGASPNPKIIKTGATRGTFWSCNLKLKSKAGQSYVMEADTLGMTQGVEFGSTSVIRISEQGVLDVKTSKYER